MPKVVLSPSREAEAQKFTNFKGTIEKRLVIKGYRKDHFILKVWGVPRSTGYQKLADPRKLSYPEMVRLVNLLDFTEEEKGEIL